MTLFEVIMLGLAFAALIGYIIHRNSSSTMHPLECKIQTLSKLKKKAPPNDGA